MNKKPRTRILIVDDDADHNDLEKDALLNADKSQELHQAYTAKECLGVVGKSRFDLVILDYTLPDMNGLELMESLSEVSPDVPVLMVTGHGDESVAVEAMKKGAYDYLTKTPDRSFLDAIPLRVASVLRQHGTELQKRDLEEKVRQTRDYLEMVIENAGDAVMVLDLSGRVLNVNRAGLEMLGKTMKGLRSTSIFKFVKKEEDKTGLKKALDADEGVTKRTDIAMIGAEDRPLEVSVSSSSILVNGKKRAVLIVRDMTEMHNMQRQLIAREKLAAIGELVGSVAHELNNKLGPILGYAELMQRSVKDEKTRQRLRVIEDSALKAKGIIEALLGFSRHRKPLRSLFNLNKVLLDALSLMEFRLKRSKVQVELDMADNLPDVFADSVQVQQMFVNLLKNAYQAVQEIDQKRIKVRTSKQNDAVLFSVSDSGVGISDGNLNRVFDPFFTTRKFGKGVGLGLSVAYGMVKEHSGDIAIESEENKGTKVTVTLPIGDASAVPGTAERKAP